MRTTVTFDGFELTAAYRVSDLRTSLLPQSLGSVDVPGRDGSLYTGSRLSSRTITLTLTTMAKSVEERQDAARELAAALAVDEPKPLAISIDGGLYWLAMPTSTADGERFLNATRFEVEFTAFDPVMYGVERTVTVPSGGSVSFLVGGTYPTMPVVSAPSAKNDSATGNWQLWLDDTDHLVATIPAGVSTAPVVADCAARTLRVNDSLALLVPSADWLVLTPGEHELEMVGTGAATVTYVERWL